MKNWVNFEFFIFKFTQSFGIQNESLFYSAKINEYNIFINHIFQRFWIDYFLNQWAIARRVLSLKDTLMFQFFISYENFQQFIDALFMLSNKSCKTFWSSKFQFIIVLLSIFSCKNYTKFLEIVLNYFLFLYYIHVVYLHLN